MKGSVVLEVDRYSNIVWEYHHPDQHHDAYCLQNGNFLLLCLEKIPRSLVSHVKGNSPGAEAESERYANVIHEINHDGEVVWSWHAYEHLDSEISVVNSRNSSDRRTYGNFIKELADGNIVLRLSNISTTVVIDRNNGNILQKFEEEVSAQKQSFSERLNVNFLNFDNSTHNSYTNSNYSHTLEVNHQIQEVLWEYADHPYQNYFSPYISGIQQLPNGNMLITEGSLGRLLEVTSNGEIVWEYINPHSGTRSRESDLIAPNQSFVFQAFRYTRDEIPWL